MDLTIQFISPQRVYNTINVVRYEKVRIENRLLLVRELYVEKSTENSNTVILQSAR